MFVSVRFYVYVVYVRFVYFHGFESPVVAYVLCVVNPCVCAYLCMCWFRRVFMPISTCLCKIVRKISRVFARSCILLFLVICVYFCACLFVYYLYAFLCFKHFYCNACTKWLYDDNIFDNIPLNDNGIQSCYEDYLSFPAFYPIRGSV